MHFLFLLLSPRSWRALGHNLVKHLNGYMSSKALGENV